MDASANQGDRLDTIAYFTLLSGSTEGQSTLGSRRPGSRKFAKIGLVPGKDFDATKLKADFVKRIPGIAQDRIMLRTRSTGI